MTARSLASLAGLLATTFVGLAYLGAGVLGLNPLRHTTTVTVHLPSSGGLMRTSPVDLRGVAIGRVRGLAPTPDGVDAVVEFDARHRIPAASTVRVANLSAAGEQYLDFRPDSAAGPYLGDGAVVPRDRVRVAVTAAEAMAGLNTLLGQVDPAVVDGLVTTVDAATRGRDGELDRLAESADLFAKTLRDKRAAVARLWRNLQTLADDLDGHGATLAEVAPIVARADPEVVHLIKAFQDYSVVGEHIWDDSLNPVMRKMNDYAAALAPDLALLATAVRPATAPLRPLRLDAGSIVDLLDHTFPGDGAAHLAIPN
ncbi:MlaD family protein [Nocardia pseudobrasiliensis]|uniref:Phospholipid/cholesterol/gamma-HCH transport system substrate-binding protein n=1 Tax=Nocardia pseudobrasiliensis TaxID=45979 RepID=A0A370HRZ3_9NOCA|nr:MlaD family protein [Nocardia pseudobrasiliensis]RDI61297.1 phospholipid/cholesterol/gamma-HCH transport system substrate-binding protein [Nocardia pseudobrasiliensis]